MNHLGKLLAFGALLFGAGVFTGHQFLPAKDHTPETKSTSASKRQITAPRDSHHSTDIASLLQKAKDSGDEKIDHDLLVEWAQKDFDSARAFAESLPPGDARDYATFSLVNQVTQIDPSSAFDWAETITDPKLRVQRMYEVIRTWKGEDPETARAATLSANVTAQQRENLLRQIEK